jgi:hypothetical protein
VAPSTDAPLSSSPMTPARDSEKSHIRLTGINLQIFLEKCLTGIPVAIINIMLTV